VFKLQKGSIRFTLLWLEENRWEGKDYTVNVRQQEGAAHGRMNPRRRKARSKEATTVGYTTNFARASVVEILLLAHNRMFC